MHRYQSSETVRNIVKLAAHSLRSCIRWRRWLIARRWRRGSILGRRRVIRRRWGQGCSAVPSDHARALHRNVLAVRVHALHISRVVLPLQCSGRALCRAYARCAAKQQTGTRAYACTLMSSQQGAGRRTDGGADYGARHSALHSGVRGRSSANSILRKLPARRIVGAELVEVLSGARHHCDAGTGGHRCAGCKHGDRKKRRKDDSRIHLDKLDQRRAGSWGARRRLATACLASVLSR